MEWEVIFYENSEGIDPVSEFLNSLAVQDRAKVTRLFSLLARYGVLLKEPYTRQIRGKLRELRVIGKDGNIRILYFGMTGKRFVLLHGFMKKTGKTPAQDINIALKRMEDFMERYGEGS